MEDCAVRMHPLGRLRLGPCTLSAWGIPGTAACATKSTPLWGVLPHWRMPMSGWAGVAPTRSWQPNSALRWSSCRSSASAPSGPWKRTSPGQTASQPGEPRAGVKIANEPGVARFLVLVCSQTPRPYSSPRSAHAIDASLLDLLMLRDVRLAHGSSMYHRCLDGVKDILGLGSEDSLAEHGVARYGARGIVSLLHISASLADLQFSQTSAHITPRMGYAGLDAYADALDDCHFMTAAFARWILKTDPSPAKVAALAANGRLAEYGISPAELDPEKLRAELAKVDVAAVAGSLPDVDAGSFSAGTSAAAPRTGVSVAGPIYQSSTTARREVLTSLSRRLRAIPLRPETPSRNTFPVGNPTSSSDG